MAKAYVIEEDGRTKPMTVIRCTDEEQKLQLILENNPDLIPGDQINPADPGQKGVRVIFLDVSYVH